MKDVFKGTFILHKMYYLTSVTQITGRTRSKSTKTVTNDIEDSDVDMKNDVPLFKGIYSMKCIAKDDAASQYLNYRKD